MQPEPKPHNKASKKPSQFRYNEEQEVKAKVKRHSFNSLGHSCKASTNDFCTGHKQAAPFCPFHAFQTFCQANTYRRSHKSKARVNSFVLID